MTDNTEELAPAGSLATEQAQAEHDAAACASTGDSSRSGTFPVLLDTVAYKSKPGGYDVAHITRRLQQAGPAMITAAQFCKAVGEGRTWTGGIYEPCRSGWGEFKGQRLFGLDFDNTTEGKQHTQLHEGDSGYLHPLDALRRLYENGITPLCLYMTFSAIPEAARFRIVVDAGEVIEEKQKVQETVLRLMGLFPECDPACRNSNRLFYGGREVWQPLDERNEWWQAVKAEAGADSE